MVFFMVKKQITKRNRARATVHIAFFIFLKCEMLLASMKEDGESAVKQ